MKKLVAIVLSLAMMLCVGAAFATEAEQTDVIEINWPDIEAQGAETIAQGDFVTFDEIAVKIWIPNVFAAVELSDEDREQGYIGYYQVEDGSAAIGVMYVEVGMTLEEYKEQAVEAGASDVEDVIINGGSAVSYTMSESDTACVSMITDSGYVFEVSGAPVSDEEFASLLSIVMASIQAD